MEYLERVNKSPILFLAIAFMAGIVFSRYGWEYLWPIILIAIVGAIVLLVFKRRYEALLLLTVAIGFINGHRVVTSPGSCFTEKTKIQFTKATVKAIYKNDNNVKLLLHTTDPFESNCYLRAYDVSDSLVEGDEIFFTGLLKPIHNDTSNDDFLRLFYYRHDIHYEGTASQISVYQFSHHNLWTKRFNRIKQSCVDILISSHLNEATSNFIIASLLGDDKYLDPNFREKYSMAGLAHMLALSGMHVAILGIVFSFLLMPFSLAGLRKVVCVVLILLLWIYAILTGMSSSVVRAVLMVTFVMIARLLEYKYSSLNSLSLAAIAILIFVPQELFAPGFQLSFLAMLFLIVLPRVINVPRHPNFFARWSINYLIFTISAVIGTLGLAVYYFHIFPLFFLITNIPCSLIFPPILIGGMIVLLLGLYGLDFIWVDKIIDFLYNVLNWIIETIVNWPFTSVTDLYIPIESVIAYYLFIITAISAYYYRNRIMATIGLIMGFVVFLLLISPKTPSPCIVIINDGSGASIADIKYSNNSRIFLTCNKAVEEAVVSHVYRSIEEQLRQRGIEMMEIIHTDMSGAGAILSTNGHRVLIINDDCMNTSQYEPVDVIIVMPFYRGNINELCRKMQCDEVILTTGLHWRLKSRYEKELIDSGRHAIRDTYYEL